ncbi:hypothetical protein F4804DRAFT_329984 [Jackrogersella minutella]|nr:hypothetical protein F4804DRAFT_329984 [Jackrogersella minutella]
MSSFFNTVLQKDSSPTPTPLKLRPEQAISREPPASTHRTSEVSSQSTRPSESMSPEELEVYKILACMKEETDRSRQSNRAPLTQAMSQQGDNQMEPAKQRTNTDASVKKYIADIDRAVGGPPSDSASKETWDIYVDAFINEKNRRDEEEARNSWTQLAKAEQFIEKMSHQPFRLLGHSSDNEDRPKAAESITPGRTTKKSSTKKPQQAKQIEENAQSSTTTDSKTAASNGASSNGKAAAKRTRRKSDSIPLLNPAEASEPQSGPRPYKKKRRSGPETLASQLGKNWEPQVDEQGHRPTRRAKRM